MNKITHIIKTLRYDFSAEKFTDIPRFQYNKPSLLDKMDFSEYNKQFDWLLFSVPIWLPLIMGIAVGVLLGSL
jgi:hypothetical protein